jgi:hypothetical protein
MNPRCQGFGLPECGVHLALECDLAIRAPRVAHHSRERGKCWRANGGVCKGESSFRSELATPNSPPELPQVDAHSPQCRLQDQERLLLGR